MFCRFCGKSIRENSNFCSHCGKSQAPAIQPPAPDRPEKIDIYTLELLASVCFYVGIVGFLILFMKMAPGIGGGQFIAYIIGAAVTIAAAVMVHKIRNKRYTQKRQLIALVFGLLLLIPSVTLRIVYECKVDTALADVPDSGTVCVVIDVDEEFYSYYYEGMVREPYSEITLDGRDDSTMYVELNRPYTARISAGYEGRSGVAASAASGSKEITVTFTQSDLHGEYTINEQVSIDGGYANVTVTFQRICPFWDVIFY